MYLLLKNFDSTDLSSFCEYLSAKLHKYSMSDEWYEPELTILWNNYFDELYAKKSAKPNVKAVFQAYFSNLRCEAVADGVILGCDKAAKLDGINELVVDLAQIINYGTLDMPRYQIFDKLFDFVADNIDNEYAEWEVSTNVS